MLHCSIVTFPLDLQPVAVVHEEFSIVSKFSPRRA